MFDTLKKYFGYDSFRDGQLQIVNSIVNGKDTVGIMPTGAGKSICFQVPALMFEGITIVISPLISLMKDQVMALQDAGVPSAFINSSLTFAQMNNILENASFGEYKLLYVAPERLESEDFVQFAQRAKISMVTVDEAHCISQWGQDFRPSYAKIPEFISKLQVRPIVSAFTATATQKVKEDIIEQLQLVDPFVLVTGYDRTNLFFSVDQPKDKFQALTDFLQTQSGLSGIIYCSSRKSVENVCKKLQEKGYNATRYHAGLSDNERKENQEIFLYDKAEIMVATNAFGMGIDKSNVNFVVHYNMPKDIESYYQEAGRAGRDGTNSQCLLLYSPQDVKTNEFLIKENYKDEKDENRLEQDRQRLKQMTFYSTTNDCLRGFILKYFGEEPANFCGNCGNCNTKFQVENITIVTQKIISCVKRMGESFGATLVVDVLRGSKSERIKALGFDKLSTYGIITDMSKHTLLAVIEFLYLHEYLKRGGGDYPIVKLGKNARLALQADAYIEMKLPKEREKRQRKETAKKSTPFIQVSKERQSLFEALRVLRREISTAQNVPPYVVFADKALVDMCAKLPTTKDEFLNVSGVGKKKLDSYADDFINEIVVWLAENESE